MAYLNVPTESEPRFETSFKTLKTRDLPRVAVPSETEPLNTFETSSGGTSFYVYYHFGPYRRYMEVCMTEREVEQVHLHMTSCSVSYAQLSTGKGVLFHIEGEKHTNDYVVQTHEERRLGISNLLHSKGDPYEHTAMSKKYTYDSEKEVMYLVDDWSIDEMDFRCYPDHKDADISVQDRFPKLYSIPDIISRTLNEYANGKNGGRLSGKADVPSTIQNLVNYGGVCTWECSYDTFTIFHMEVYVLRWFKEKGVVPSHFRTLKWWRYCDKYDEYYIRDCESDEIPDSIYNSI